MARHSQHTDRKRGRTVVAASFAVAGLAITGAGVYAGLNAQATGTQAVSSGTLKLVQLAAGTSGGFGQTYSEMAPGDAKNIYVDVRDTGTIAAKDMTLAVTGTGGTLLTTDATRGLHVTVESCSVAWVGGNCADGITGLLAGLSGGTTVVDNQPVSALGTADPLVTGAVTKYNAATAVATSYHYKITTSLPDSSETTTNGVLPNSTIQGLGTTLTFTFDEAQRAGTTADS